MSDREYNEKLKDDVDPFLTQLTALREFSCFSLGSSRGSNPGVIRKWELAADDVDTAAAAAADGDRLR